MSEGLIGRIWHTEIDPDRAEEYEKFAREVSLPMVKAQPGFAAALMLRNGASCRVITVWTSHEAIAALDGSPSYRETVERILAEGFIRGEQSVELFGAHLLATQP
jgi:heme-degrading monooxygenase HmoA